MKAGRDMERKKMQVRTLLRTLAAISFLLSLLSLCGVFLLPGGMCRVWLARCGLLLCSAFLFVIAIALLIPEAAASDSAQPGFPVLGPLAHWLACEFLDPGTLGRGNQKLASEVLKTQAQIIALQNQINPHFLYNTLESIRSKALLHDEEEIATMTEILARLFRYNIGRAEESATIADELENVKNYVSIQNYRFRNKFILQIHVEEIQDVLETYLIPPLTLQPIIENAVHYGLEQKIGQGTITIDCFTTQSKLILEVSDDGLGMSAEAVDQLREKLRTTPAIPTRVQREKKSSGIALANVHQRIRLLFGDQYGLEVRSAPEVGTQIDVVLPAPSRTEKEKHEN